MGGIKSKSILPNLPIIKSFSSVAILESLKTDIFFSPLSGDGARVISNSSIKFNWVEINETVTSRFPTKRISAGLNLEPYKSENEKGTKTISPLFIYTFLLNH